MKSAHAHKLSHFWYLLRCFLKISNNQWSSTSFFFSVLYSWHAQYHIFFFKPLSPNSDQHQISPCNIIAYSTPEVTRIKDMITQGEFCSYFNNFSTVQLFQREVWGEDRRICSLTLGVKGLNRVSFFSVINWYTFRCQNVQDFSAVYSGATLVTHLWTEPNGLKKRTRSYCNSPRILRTPGLLLLRNFRYWTSYCTCQ